MKEYIKESTKKTKKRENKKEGNEKGKEEKNKDRQVSTKREIEKHYDGRDSSEVTNPATITSLTPSL